MSIYDYEAAFGQADSTTKAMRKAVQRWFSLYYDQIASEESDPCQRVAYTVVNKLSRRYLGNTAPLPGMHLPRISSGSWMGMPNRRCSWLW